MVDGVDMRDLAAVELPAALASCVRPIAPGDTTRIWLPSPGVLDRARLDDILVGAGLTLRRRESSRPSVLTRSWTLPDTIGPGMRLLICGLNPSPASADAGVGFARPGNRFWPAALAAGLVQRDRNPDHALRAAGVGMTDIVKRTTRRADELDPQEYIGGFDRLRRLLTWLSPSAICFVGLAGWRVAADRKARPGWQAEPLAGVPVYLMPSTSGLNASSQLPDLTDHLRAAAAGPPTS